MMNKICASIVALSFSISLLAMKQDPFPMSMQERREQIRLLQQFERENSPGDALV